MTWIMKMYLLAIKLYPRPFRARFAAEMGEVFHSGLEEAYKQGVIVEFVMREIMRLPSSLAGVYIWSMRAGESRPVAVSGLNNGGTVGVSMSGEGRGSSLMAGLPHFLIGIFIVGSTLIGALKGINLIVFGYLLMIIFGLLLIGVLLYSINKGWKHWSTSWIVYMFIFAISLLDLAVNALLSSITSGNS
jgi:hypothetical protein